VGVFGPDADVVVLLAAEGAHLDLAYRLAVHLTLTGRNWTIPAMTGKLSLS
jgi:hypothetical protein